MSDSYFYDTLPKKRMAAGALLLDEQGNILIVKPTYRPDWLLPGGSIEEDESPRAGCEREVQEEIGLDIPTISLLSIDYVSRVPDKNESVQFIFYSGVLSAEQIQRITLPPDELSEYRFVPVAEAEKLLSPRLAARMEPSLHALKEGTTAYLEDGRETWAPTAATSTQR